MLIRLCLTLMILTSTLSAAITQVESIREIKAYFEGDSQNILGVFDIDETLLVSADPAFQKPNMKKHHALVKGFYNQLPISYQDLLSNHVLLAGPSQVIEADSATVLGDLQKQNVRLIALTAALTRSFPEGNIPELRFAELSRHGFDFSTAFPECEDILFDGLPACHSSYPRYYKGVFCSNGDYNRHDTATSKGKALCAFLNHIGWKPTKIVFMDDKLYNVEEMERTLHAFDPSIEFQGLHYTGAEKMDASPVTPEYVQAKWGDLFDKVKQEMK